MELCVELTEKFDPVKFSLPECEWLITHLGESPSTAMESVTKEIAVASVRPEIERFYELCERDKNPSRRIEWVGLDTVRAALQTYINQCNKWEQEFIRTRGRAPRFPSLCTFDSKGRPYLGGVGSDSGIVKTYFAPDGTRIPFAIDVVDEEAMEWKPEWASGTDPISKGLKNDPSNNRVECLICGHTETYKEESAASVNAAKARMRKHLRSDKDQMYVNAHREALLELGG